MFADDEILLEDFLNDDETMDVVIDDNFQEPEQWTIISALNRVLALAKDSGLSDSFWEMCKNPIDFLTAELGLSAIQVVIIAILIEAGESMSWRKIGQFLGCTRLSVMVYSEDIEDLEEKRWIYSCGARENRNGMFQGYALTKGVVTALRKNQKFIPEEIDNLDIQQVIDRTVYAAHRYVNDFSLTFEAKAKYIMQYFKANTDIPVCKKVMGFKDIYTRLLMTMAVADYAEFTDTEEEGLSIANVRHLIPDEFDSMCIPAEMVCGEHLLFTEGCLEHKCVDGIADTEHYVLTRKFREEFLQEYNPYKSRTKKKPNTDNNLKLFSSIKKKNMFYNSAEQDQISRLTTLLSQENLPGIQKRLEDEGMRKGFACIFFGAPGTGKTETVLQIARQTGRDIFQVDISSMRDKYVGESEKNIKDVFNHYRSLCKNCEVMPILFFNEADGIFGKRTTIGNTNPSVEKMENAMQNIILQEMENLDGILIATTNLTQNLDSAFERRFLFKVEFHNPDIEVKTKLWSSMLGSDITEDQARVLAAEYDFSGGQIENIARKKSIEYILSGKKVDIDKIKQFCNNELLNRREEERKVIGFNPESYKKRF